MCTIPLQDLARKSGGIVRLARGLPLGRLMKFFLGLIIGAAAAWYYRSTQPDLSAPQFMEQARETVATGAQRAAEVIDRTPIPRRAKDVASRAAEKVEDVAEKAADAAEQTPTTPA
jgi:hypothetical protein